LVLRALTDADGPLLLRVFGEPEVARWLRSAGREGPFSASECVARACAGAAHWRAHGFGPWIVFDSGATVACGGLGLNVIDGRAELEVAWAVCLVARGRGIATRIGREALALAEVHGARRVIALTRVENRASRRVMDKLGMSLRRELVHGGLPHLLYDLDIATGTPTPESASR
jgi:RimJ/RimL family protein N-acetyltransferase